MADIFVSYSREDYPRILPLVDVLQSRGFTVFYDRELRAGQRFDDVLERQLREARCVIALWSNASVGSRWVHAEAGAALRKSAVIPVYLDDVRPPLGFGHIHGIDLFNWDGNPDDPRLRALVRAVDALLGHGREIAQSVGRTDSVQDYTDSLSTGARLIREIKVDMSPKFQTPILADIIR